MRENLARFLQLAMALACCAGATAKPFQTQFIRFQLPPNWSCRQEELDWVCQPDNIAERSEVILVIVTKVVNEVDDNFPKYEAVLKEAKDMRDLLGNTYKSQIKYVRQRQIKNQPWVDGLQLGSEIPGFYTRYVASIKDKVAGMITYSIAESVYPKWAPVMDAIIDSAEMFFDPKAFADLMASKPGSLLGSRGSARGRLAPNFEGEMKKEKKPTPLEPGQIAALALLLAAIGYFVWRKKRGGG